MSESDNRASWSKYGFILATIGSAVGLGNIWRFPYVVGESGGGAFLIPYILAFIVLGIPLMTLEAATGRHFRGSVVTSLRKLDGRLRYLGFLPLGIVLIVFSYYTVIAGWTLAYIGFSVFGYMDFGEFTGSLWPLVTFFATILITGLIVRLDILRGIERANRYIMPLLAVSMLVMLAKAITLPGAAEGLAYYLTPDIPALSDPALWVQAAGQVFFSLSIGFGTLLTYGSYLSKDEDIPLSASIISCADFFVAFTAGFIIFPIVFSFGFDPVSGPELAFVTLPAIFSDMFLGSLFGFVFFLLLFVGALSSMVSMLEVGVTTLVDEKRFTRQRSTLLVGLFVALIGLPSALSYAGVDLMLLGMPFLDTVDKLIGTLFVPFTALLLFLAIAWLWKPEDLLAEINCNSRIKLPYAAIYIYRYIIPVLLVLILISTAFSIIPEFL